MPSRYRIGIDPGYRYIGLSIVKIDSTNRAIPHFLAVVDLGKRQSRIPDIEGRAEKRRARRTRKTKKRRLRRIAEVLDQEGIPAAERERVLALCRRRGWRPDIGETRASESKDGEAVRIPRDQVLDRLQTLIHQGAPSLSDLGRRAILDILDQPIRPVRIHNRRVGRCAVESCSRKRSRSVHYPVLSLSQHILNTLQPDEQIAARQAFIQTLRTMGRDLAHRDLDVFRRKHQPKRARDDLQRVKQAWRQAKDQDHSLHAGAIEDIEKQITSLGRQLRGDNAPSRSHFCAPCLLDRVHQLMRGESAPPADRKARAHAPKWEAVGAKLESFMTARIREAIPEGAEVERVVLEQSDFDLLRLDRDGRGNVRVSSRHQRETISNEARWRGPWAQLEEAIDRSDPSRPELLAYEQNGRCAVCGESITGRPIDRAHLIPQDEVGGDPYVAVVATCTQCNADMGQNVVSIHPEIPAEMKAIRDRLLQEQTYVHRWIDEKYGIVKLLAERDGAEDTVRRLLSQAFSVPSSVMQGSHWLQEAIVRAVEAAGFERPEADVRGSKEVFRAREMALSPDGEEPWFNKAADKDAGKILNHAMDATIVASLLAARVEGYDREGELRWRVSIDKTQERLSILSSQEMWNEHVNKRVWDRWHKGKGQATDLTELTLNRVWRQAYARETVFRERHDPDRAADDDYNGPGAYAQPVQTWLDTLKRKGIKKNIDKMTEHIHQLRWTPLRDRAMAALASAGPDEDERYEAVEAAVIRFLKASTLEGIDGAEPGPTDHHPVQEQKIAQRREWAESDDGTVPPWVSVTLVKDRRPGSVDMILELNEGSLRLESNARDMYIYGVHGEEDRLGALYQIETDGRITFIRGQTQSFDSGHLRRHISPKGIPPLPPSVMGWREATGELLRRHGFRSAWIVGIGTELIRPSDGHIFRLGKKRQNTSFRSWLRLKQEPNRIFSKPMELYRGGIPLI